MTSEAINEAAPNIAVRNESAPALSAAVDVFHLLQTAVQQGTDPAALEKLVALQERILERNAKSAFIDAIGQFQMDCPTIVKRREVKDKGGRILYRFAPLEDIVEQVKPLLVSLGLAWSFNTSETPKGIAVTCTIRHRDGHEESTTVSIPPTQGHNTNAAQNMGIAVQYGMRYAFIGALGLTTADEDHDGAGGQRLKPISEERAADLKALIGEVGANEALFLKYLGVDSLSELPERDYDRAVAALEAKRKQS